MEPDLICSSRSGLVVLPLEMVLEPSSPFNLVGLVEWVGDYGFFDLLRRSIRWVRAHARGPKRGIARRSVANRVP